MDVGDLAEDVLDLNFLGLEVADDFVDSLEVLVSIDILRKLLPLVLEVDEQLLLVLQVLNRVLDLLFDVLDFVHFVLVLNLFVGDVLLLLVDLVGQRLLVLVPLFLEDVELLLELTYLILEDSKVLTAKLLQLTYDLTVLLGLFLLRFQLLGHLLLFLLELALLLVRHFIGVFQRLNLTLHLV